MAPFAPAAAPALHTAPLEQMNFPRHRFATGSALYNSDALIQEFYSKESTHPVSMQRSRSSAIRRAPRAVPAFPNGVQETMYQLPVPPYCVVQVHLVVDTTLQDSKFSVQAFTSRVLALGEKVLATEFVEIPCDTIFADIERVGGEQRDQGQGAAVGRSYCRWGRRPSPPTALHQSQKQSQAQLREPNTSCHRMHASLPAPRQYWYTSRMFALLP